MCVFDTFSLVVIIVMIKLHATSKKMYCSDVATISFVVRIYIKPNFEAFISVYDFFLFIGQYRHLMCTWKLTA